MRKTRFELAISIFFYFLRRFAINGALAGSNAIACGYADNVLIESKLLAFLLDTKTMKKKIIHKINFVGRDVRR